MVPHLCSEAETGLTDGRTIPPIRGTIFFLYKVKMPCWHFLKLAYMKQSFNGYSTENHDQPGLSAEARDHVVPALSAVRCHSEIDQWFSPVIYH